METKRVGFIEKKTNENVGIFLTFISKPRWRSPIKTKSSIKKMEREREREWIQDYGDELYGPWHMQKRNALRMKRGNSQSVRKRGKKRRRNRKPGEKKIEKGQ